MRREEVLYTEGSSFAQYEIRYARAMAVTLGRTVWAWSLSRGISAHRVEFLEFTKVF